MLGKKFGRSLFIEKQLGHFAVSARQVHRGAIGCDADHVKTFIRNRLPGVARIETIIDACQPTGYQLVFCQKFNAATVTAGRGFGRLPGLATVRAVKAVLPCQGIGTKITAYYNEPVSAVLFITVPYSNRVSTRRFFSLKDRQGYLKISYIQV